MLADEEVSDQLACLPAWKLISAAIALKNGVYPEHSVRAI